MRLPCAALTPVAHILTSGTPFVACRNTIPMSKTYPAETATTAVGFARLGRPFSRAAMPRRSAASRSFLEEELGANGSFAGRQHRGVLADGWFDGPMLCSAIG